MVVNCRSLKNDNHHQNKNESIHNNNKLGSNHSHSTSNDDSNPTNNDYVIHDKTLASVHHSRGSNHHSMNCKMNPRHISQEYDKKEISAASTIMGLREVATNNIGKSQRDIVQL